MVLLSIDPGDFILSNQWKIVNYLTKDNISLLYKHNKSA